MRNVTIVLLLKPKLSMVVDRLPSFFIHKTTILNISSKRTFLTLALQPIKPFMHGKLAETINKMSVNYTSRFFFSKKRGGVINYSFCHTQKAQWLFWFLNSLNSPNDHLFCWIWKGIGPYPSKQKATEQSEHIACVCLGNKCVILGWLWKRIMNMDRMQILHLS